jgi:transposase-like protein
MARRSPKRRWKQWTETEARAALAEWKQSGASMEAFAREHGFSPHRLSYWRTRLAETGEVAFVPVVSSVRSDAVIEIEGAGILVRVREGLDAEQLARVVAAVAAAARVSC